ncbi:MULTISPECIES: hypothetical protein [Streptomyces]|uniref:hypothetical protein n=1 Tax=Streptomyces TaxID=1883 RepID=UPI0031E00D2E
MLRFRIKGRVNVVITTSEIKNSRHGSASVRRSLTAEGEVLAISQLIAALARVYKQSSILIQVSERVADGLEGDLVCLGGPAANHISRDYLEAIDPERKLTFDAASCTVKFLDLEIENFDIHIESGLPKKDIALVMLSRNPLAPAGNAALCAGLTTFGTGAAAKILFRDILQGGGLSGFRSRRMLRKRPCVAIYECTLVGGRPIHYRLLKSGTL